MIFEFRSRTLVKTAAIVLGLGMGIATVCAEKITEKLSYTENGKTYYRPASLKTEQLKDFDKLSAARQKLITLALSTTTKHGWLKYKFGGSNPESHGFDCSGAMYYVLRKGGFKIPRTSAQQYLWLRDASEIHTIPANADALEHSSFSKLQPGDLLFWSGTYTPTDGRSVNISHVSLYLGQEKDGRHVMVGATKGRSYRGKAGDGYGVYDFKLPRKGSRSKFVGYGTPVGLGK
ncbi:hypothetical protein NT6N_23290 [Oceaniferula spumae]|uniref:NlpC/P60 domain-containing protein n=1 Tax=Oceaniferula spumae TaxID=2979115 RepID=A0AAT9FMV2_9BACT